VLKNILETVLAGVNFAIVDTECERVRAECFINIGIVGKVQPRGVCNSGVLVCSLLMCALLL
jgi:hypothetical protein